MKKLILILALAFAPALSAQDSDDAEIRKVIGVYFRGHATANADTMRAAFMPSAHIEGIRNGGFVSWTVDQYVANFRGTPAQDEASRTRVMDVVDKVYHAQR